MALAGVCAGATRVSCLLGAAAVVGLGCAAALTLTQLASPVAGANFTAFGLLLAVSGTLRRAGYRYCTEEQIVAAGRSVAGDEPWPARFGVRDLLLLQAAAALAALAAVSIWPRLPVQQRPGAYEGSVAFAIGLSCGAAALAGHWLVSGNATKWRRFAMAAVLVTAATILLRGAGVALLLVDELDPLHRFPIVENFADSEHALVALVLVSGCSAVAATLAGRAAGYRWHDWALRMTTKTGLPLSNLLWIDGGAGFSVGVAVLLLQPWLVDWYGLPEAVLTFVGMANLLYGCYSLSLAVRPTRPLGMIVLLAAANLAWAPVCVTLIINWQKTASWLGLAHLAGEGAFVALLACLEWRWRRELARGTSDSANG